MAKRWIAIAIKYQKGFQMDAVRVDVSRGKSTVAVLRSKSDVVMRPYDVTRDAQGLAILVEKLKEPDGKIKIVMKHTDTFFESIAMFPHYAGFYVSAVNPLLKGIDGRNRGRSAATTSP